MMLLSEAPETKRLSIPTCAVTSRPFSSPPLVSLLPVLPPTDTSNALALPPLATYPSKEALFEAIQS
jgi:hypothetical protein